MKITEKQALIMFDILRHALQFVGGFAGYTTKTLTDITEKIIRQQSDEPIELEGDKNEEDGS